MAYEVERHTSRENTSRRPGGISYIVVHYTGSGTSRAGSARANCVYFSGGNRGASADYFIDDAHVCQYNPDVGGRFTWAVGDGRGRYGVTNANSVSIEVCGNGEPFTEEQVARLAWLVGQLMGRYGVDAAHVVRHWDASRKACPLYYTPEGAGGQAAWRALHARITSGQEDDMTPNDVWAFDNGGEQTNTVAGSAWTNLMDIDRRVQQIQGDLGSDGTHSVLDNAVDTNLRVQAVQVQLAALSEAVRALAEAQGADPGAVAKAVGDAVAAKLATIELRVATSG